MPLITAERIKQIVNISKNIDNNILSPYIILAELKYIKPVLGQLLYPDIVTKYTNQTLNSYEIELLTNIQYSLAHYIIENVLPFMTYSITEKGLQIQYGVNSEPADNKSTTQVIDYIRNEMQVNGEFFLNEVNKYLEENKSQFPLYTTNGNKPDNQSSFDSGIAFFPNNNNKNSYFL